METSTKRNARTHYDVLGLTPTCSPKEIRNAYIRLCKQLHPDVNPGGAAQHKKFVELNDAYATLINAETRSIYDGSLLVKGSKQWQRHWNKAEQRGETWDTQNESPNYHSWYQSGQSYKHVKSVESKWIILGCFSLLAAGSLLYFFIYRFSQTHILRKAEEKSQKISSSYTSAKKKLMVAAMIILLEWNHTYAFY